MTRAATARSLVLGTTARIPGPEATFHVAFAPRHASLCGEPLGFTARSATLRLPRLALCETCVRLAGTQAEDEAHVA